MLLTKQSSGQKLAEKEKQLRGKTFERKSTHTYVPSFSSRLPGHLQMRLMFQDKGRRKMLPTLERMS